MKILNNLPQIFGNISNDILKFIDKTDALKEILGKDELLSSTSIGKVIQFFVKEAIKIGDKNEAFKSAIGLVYLQTLLEAMEFHQVEVNNLGIKEATNFNVTNFKIDSFFDDELVQFYRVEYERVLNENGVNKEVVTKLQSYIKDNAKINFFNLLEDKPIVYEELINYLKSDKYKEEFKKNQKNIYKGYLKSRYEDVIFNNEKNLTLKDVYIEPYFRIHKNCLKKDLYLNENEKGFVNYEYSIHNFIYDSLNDKIDKKLDKETVQVIFLLGYAGQGKSSFCKRFIYDIVTQKQPFSENIYFVELRNIPNPKELIEKPFDTLKEYIESETKLEDFNSSILVLDGLDELFMKSGLASSDIDKFCIYLIENVKKQKIIVTSRYGYISLENKKLKYKNSLVVELQELNKSQQINWIEKYKKFYNDLYLNENKLNELYENNKKYGHILELINQPILLYMMVTIGEFNEKDLSRAELYNLVFDTLIKRQWAKEGIKENLKDIYRTNLRNILGDIAIEIYQSDYEYIHKSRVEEIESVKRFKEDLINLFDNKNLKDSLKVLMVSFYLKESKKDSKDNFEGNEKYNEYAIEFLHKSLMEYLVAEKIWDSMNEFLDYNSRKRKYNIDDFSEALELLSKLFSKKLLSDEIVNYLIEIIESDKSIDKKLLTDRLEKFFPEMLERDFLYQFEVNDTNPIDKGLNTFYGFWTILSHISEKNHIKESFKEKFADTINFFKRKNIGAKLNLSYQNLSKAKFYFTIFKNTNLVRVDLNEANLNGADLVGADLVLANLKEVNLVLANLKEANLFEAKLKKADLSEVDLSEVILSETNLFKANLSETDLRKVKYLDEAIGVPEYILRDWKKFNKK